MMLDTEKLRQIAGTIWVAVLDLPMEPVNAAPVDRLGRSIVGWIQITGGWTGAILLDCPIEVARLAASTMFAVSPEAVQVSDMEDAISELVNMVGGNFKAILPEACALSLPGVVKSGEHPARVPGSRRVGSMDFGCRGRNVCVTVLEQAKRPATTAARG